MNAIIGMTHLALDETLSPVVRDYLETSVAAANNLLQLLNEILDFSRIEAGKFSLDVSSFSLSSLLRECTKTMAVRAYSKGLELACEVRSDLPDLLEGDSQRLRQILFNLIGNAVKFTPDGEVLLVVREESRSGNQITLLFDVHDTGIGISAEDQERIFAPFAQADTSTTREFGGTGLGLAISSDLVRMMGGRLWVQSTPGKGSIFSFTAQFTILDTVTADSELEDIAALRDLPVLIVDDNSTSARILDAMLKRFALNPLVATNHEQALRLLGEAANTGRPYPVVILDALLLGENGAPLAETLLANPRLAGSTIGMLSSVDRQTHADRFENCQFAAYLQKPVSEPDVLGAIREALGKVTTPLPDLAVAPPAPPSEPVSSRALRVLLAEDTAANQKLVRAILEKRGHEVGVAHNGREAIDALKHRDFDLILMDVQMPVMDGLQAAAAIRALPKRSLAQIPIVAMTAHTMPGDKERCLAAGMDAYLSKPINSQKLIDMLDFAMQIGEKRTALAALPGDPKTLLSHIS